MIDDQAVIAAEILNKFQKSCVDILDEINQLSRELSSSPCTPQNLKHVQFGNQFTPSPGGCSGYSASDSSPGSEGWSPPCRQTKSDTRKRPGETHLVKPNLEEILQIVEFGMGCFVEERKTNFDMLKCSLRSTQTELVDGMELLVELESVMDGDLQSLPELINLWSQHAKHLQQLHQLSIDQCKPVPDLSAINPASAWVSQHAYTELLRSGTSLCLEVERGLRLAEIMYSKLDDTLQAISGDFMRAYNKLCAAEATRQALAAEVQEWTRRFKESEHAVNNFLVEWEKGEADPNEADNCPGFPPLQPPCPRSCPQSSSSSCPESPETTPRTRELNREIRKGSERIEKLEKICAKKKEELNGLQSMIQRFNNLNTSINQEVQHTIKQQEVLNESLRAMDELSQSNASEKPKG